MRSRVSYSIWRCTFPRRLATPLQQKRSFSQAKARFVTINEKGIPASFETEIRVGYSHQASIYIEPKLGDLIRLAVTQQQTDPGNDLKKLPMVFHHASRHFSLRDVPHPRVEIDQDLPR
ncbi:hypothetical protein B0T11DRAFT_284981 [Plectosphaerella cucumerina]|uniref:Uncharacterized protein n=1 Tax=Plectosphaerella cucumerina TaxID=40658 RepID=A0A8K0TD17_9PEZI|nr:hypothetical protein B0T11DRAFT_284981 [Plectosphaerella cucumerina]